MVKPVQLPNGRTWRTQAAAKAHYKEILNRHGDGQRVQDANDHADLLALLQVYDQGEVPASSKTGAGVDHFYRDRDQEHGGLTSCFYVRRVDGSCVDFSYLRAVEVASRSQGTK